MIRIIIFLIIALSLIPVVYVSADQTVVMELKGMTCSLCPLAVKKSISSVEGVKDIEVSYEKGKAWLTVEDSVTDKSLSDAIRKAGYGVKVIERKTVE